MDPNLLDDLLPFQEEILGETSTFFLENFDKAFLGVEIDFEKDFYQLLELPDQYEGNDQTCNSDNLVEKKKWFVVYHPEVHQSNNFEDDYANFSLKYLNTTTIYEPDADNIYISDIDACGSFNVMYQVERAEEFSQNYLHNPPWSSLAFPSYPSTNKLYIFSDYGSEWKDPTHGASYDFPHGAPSDYTYFHPDGYNGNAFIKLYGGLRFAPNFLHQYDLWSNNTILHELGHAYHFRFTNVALHGNGGKWSKPRELANGDPDYGGPYKEGFADFFSSAVRLTSSYNNTENFDNMMSSDNSSLLSCDNLRFISRYLPNTIVSVYDLHRKNLETPSRWQSFFQKPSNNSPLRNANNIKGAVVSSFWDLCDGEPEITEGTLDYTNRKVYYNYDQLALPFDDLWSYIKNSSDMETLFNYYCNNGLDDYYEFINILHSHNINFYRTIDQNTNWSSTIDVNNEGVNIDENAILNISDNSVINLTGVSKIVANGNLIIGNNVTFTGTNEFNIIEVNGSISLGDNVNFISSNGENWGGLEIHNNSSISLNSPSFENCNLVTGSGSTSIDDGLFDNTQINAKGSGFILTNSELSNSFINADCSSSIMSESIFRLIENNINNTTVGNTIEASGYNNFEIYKNIINSNGNGIYLYECGIGNLKKIENNVLTGSDTAQGIKLYHTYAEITGCNEITGFSQGIVGQNNCNIKLEGTNGLPYQKIHNNNHVECVFVHESFPYIFRYNQIYDANHDDELLVCIYHDPNSRAHNTILNYWGGQFDPLLDFVPSDGFTYLPMWRPSTPSAKSDPEVLFDQAQQYIDEGCFDLAEQTYKLIISTYPQSEFASASAKALLILEEGQRNSYEELKIYFETDPAISAEPELNDLAEYLANYCDIYMGNYEEAIYYFEDIIANPDNPADSIFAVIDAGYTYLLMEAENRSQFIGKMKHLKPDSMKDFKKNRESLLTSLIGEGDNNSHTDIPASVVMFGNYPNPFNPTTTISYSIPNDSNVCLNIYNVKGQKVKTLIDEPVSKGKHNQVWNGINDQGDKVSSGIYFYKLDVNGKTKSTKKCLLLK